MAEISKEQFENLRKLAGEAGLSDHDFSSVMYKVGARVKPETYDEEQYKNQNPGTRLMEGAEEMANSLNKANPMVPIGKAIGWGIDKVDKMSEVNPGYRMLKKPFEKAREGYEKALPEAADAAFESGNKALGYGLGTLGIAGELSSPRNPIDMGMAALGNVKGGKAPKGAGQLELQLRAADEMRPEVVSKLRKAAPSPFDALDQLKSIETKVQDTDFKLKELTAQEGAVESANAAGARTLGADLPFRGDLDLGNALREGVEATRKKAKAPLAAEQTVLEGLASKEFGQPTNTIKKVHEILTDDVNAGLINMTEDASVNRILRRITGLEKPQVKGKIGFDPETLGKSLDDQAYKTDRRATDLSRPDVPVEITKLKDTKTVNVNLQELMQADKDLFKLVKKETDPAGNMTPKGALLGKVKDAVRQDIDTIAADVWKAEPELAAKIPALRAKWKNYFEVFDNDTIRKVRKVDDPGVLFDSIKKSEQAMQRLQTALGPDAPVYREFKTKYTNELLVKMDKADNPIEVLEAVLQEPSGKEALTKFYTDAERGELRGIATGKVKVQNINEEYTMLEKELDELQDRTSSKRLGDLDKLRDRRAGAKASERIWEIIQNKAGQHAVRYGVSGLTGSALFVTGHPIVAGASLLAGVAPDVVSAGYANSPKFRVAINSLVDAPSAAKAVVLENAAKEYMASRKDEETSKP